MRIALVVNTPAQAHFVKNLSMRLQSDGHETLTLLRNYGENTELMKDLKGNTVLLAGSSGGVIRTIGSFPMTLMNATTSLKDFSPDLVFGGGPYTAYPSRLLRNPVVEFRDGESSIAFAQRIQVKAYSRFVDTIVTPMAFTEDLGTKQVRIRGYKELAYLHPNNFTPDKRIRDELGVDDNEEFALLRTNAFDALHDIGKAGLRLDDLRTIVTHMSKQLTVFISSEYRLPKDLERLRLPCRKSRIHHVISAARLLVADTGTMVTEAACLGTPAVLFHSSAGRLSNFMELEHSYGLIYSFERDFQALLRKVLELLTIQNLASVWNQKRQHMLSEKIDVTAFLYWFLTNYPQSTVTLREDPEFQSRFK